MHVRPASLAPPADLDVDFAMVRDGVVIVPGEHPQCRSWIWWPGRNAKAVSAVSELAPRPDFSTRPASPAADNPQVKPPVVVDLDVLFAEQVGTRAHGTAARFGQPLVAGEDDRVRRTGCRGSVSEIGHGGDGIREQEKE